MKFYELMRSLSLYEGARDPKTGMLRETTFLYALKLYGLATGIRARRILEIGAGPANEPVSGLTFAYAMGNDGHLVSVDIDPERPAVKHWQHVEGLGVLWTIIHSDSMKLNPWDVKGEPFDLLYVDGDHSEDYAREDILRFAPMVRPGGLIVVDDYPASGGVVAAVDKLGIPGVVLGYDFQEDGTLRNGHWIHQKTKEIE